MLKIIDVLYYNLYRFNNDVVKNGIPEGSTKFQITAIFVFDFESIIGPFLSYFFKIDHSRLIYVIPFFLLVLILFHLYFKKNNRALKILKDKPMLFSSDQISILITAIFFITLPIIAILSATVLCPLLKLN